CVCGSNSTGCQFRKGAKECFCKKNTFNNGMLCEECQCGIGSVGCKNETGEKVCACYEAYKQCFDKCERCDCGLDGGNCSFSDAGEKQCSCPPGFTMPKATGICTQVCNATQMCQNGGTCVQGEQVCACTEDYTGDWCQTPKWCLTTPCGQNDEVLCRWNDTSRKGYCECRKPKHYYIEETRKCYECNCGENGECILAYDAKVCICQEGYADYLLNCKPCNCGSHSTNCSFYSGGEVMCHCEEGYKQKTVSWWSVPDSCAPCDCGSRGATTATRKVCDCEDKYRELNGECRECDCDPWNLKGASNRTPGRPQPEELRKRGIQVNCHDMICKDIDECAAEIRDACAPPPKRVNSARTYECECKDVTNSCDPTDPKFAMQKVTLYLQISLR
ncbi:EGF-like domain-containing protein, partial [Caerostris extrusa]